MLFHFADWYELALTEDKKTETVKVVAMTEGYSEVLFQY